MASTELLARWRSRSLQNFVGHCKQDCSNGQARWSGEHTSLRLPRSASSEIKKVKARTRTAASVESSAFEGSEGHASDGDTLRNRAGSFFRLQEKSKAKVHIHESLRAQQKRMKSLAAFTALAVASVLLCQSGTRRLMINFPSLQESFNSISKTSISDSSLSEHSKPPNVLFIMTDQQRFDALRRAQDEMSIYDNKVKIRTPNMDRIAENGVYFRTAYCAAPTCVPARASLRTGNTIQRTGCQANAIVNDESFKLMNMFKDKINALETYDHLLVDKLGYIAEYYGKWHLPRPLYYSRQNDRPIFEHNDYDFKTSTPKLNLTESGDIYQKRVQYLATMMNISQHFSPGQQLNSASTFPYDPLSMDARFGMPTNPEQKGKLGQPVGIDTLPAQLSSTGVFGEMAIHALERLASKGSPFSLTASFVKPHAPFLAAPEYFDYYNDKRSNLMMPQSLYDPLTNSAYAKSNRGGLSKHFNTSDPILEWIAVYYSMVEEVDHWVGKLLDKLEELGLNKNTLVVFTSDHGEMLGAHDMHGKGNLLEEATRVPLLMSFPGRITPGTVVEEAVSHIDVVATILDYLGASELDKSDGTSLRRFIEKKNINENFDEETVVSELSKRSPVSETMLSGHLGKIPNFMIRKGHYKLIITKKVDSKTIDMMYDLKSDPQEMNNLLGVNGDNASLATIGKAEHLKILLMEWMQRNDGPHGYYSDRKYNGLEGNGDIAEVRGRRTWRTVDYWQSDTEVLFGKPVRLPSGEYVRNEYFYVGRTSSNAGKLRIFQISVQGPDAGCFRVDQTAKVLIDEGEHIRIKISFTAQEPISIQTLDAYIEIHNNVNGIKRVNIVAAK